MYSLNGKELPVAAVGTWAWGPSMNGSKLIFGQVTPEEDLKQSFDVAYNKGFTLWDTAPVYANGVSEERLGKYSQGKEIIISDKYRPSPSFDSDEIDKTLAQSVRRFGGRKPDVYFLHQPKCVEQNLEYFCKLKEENKIGEIGVSNFTAENMEAAERILSCHGFKIGAVQNHYSLLYRNSEKAGILKYCIDNNIPFFAYMVLEQGALTGKYTSSHPFKLLSRRGLAFPKRKLKKLEPLFDVMSEVGKEYNLTIAQVAEVWAISKGTLPLIGVTKPYQAESLKDIRNIVFSAEEIKIIESAAEETQVTRKGEWEPEI